MCGILWVQSKKKKSAVKPLLKRFRNQEGRGTDGFGYVSVALDGTVSEVIRATEEKDIIAALNNENSAAILMHHRSPTSLPNYEGATHPFVVKDARFKYDYIVVHNGVIRNFELMFEDFKKDGYTFLSEMKSSTIHEFVNTKEWYEFDEKNTINDSEAFAVDLAKNLEDKATYIRSTGTIAFIALQVDKETNKVVNLIWGKNEGNPLMLEDDKALFCLKSAGSGKPVGNGTFYIKNWITGQTTEKKASGLEWNWGNKKEGKHAGFRTPPTDVPARSNPIVSGQDEDIEDAIARMLPAPRSGTELDRERSLGRDSERAFKDFGENAEYYEELPVIEMEDLGFPESMLEDEISAADAAGSEDAGVIRQLRDDLKDELDVENEAIDELNMAKDILRTAVKNKEQLSELEKAKALVYAAEEDLKRASGKRKQTEAELGAYVGVNAWTKGAGGDEDGDA